VPALQVVTRIASLAKVKAIVAPGVGVKDGILTELIAKHYRVWDYGTERDKLLAAGLQLGRRYHFDERHAMRVSALALEFFDGTQSIHGLSDEDRSVLRLAALLHDVGDFLNPSGHHKHSEYIIESSEVMGLPFERRQIIAQVARYHRRSFPTTRHPKFKALDEDTRERVRRLAAILRVADALDRGHRSKVDKLSIVRRRQDAAGGRDGQRRRLARAVDRRAQGRPVQRGVRGDREAERGLGTHGFSLRIQHNS
jgi:exopolyphosphatase/guanosine-5'-triphosphate,3'-diphosphate pyrophosphatase